MFMHRTTAPEIPIHVNEPVKLGVGPKDLAFHFFYQGHRYQVRWIAELDIEGNLEYYNVELYDGQQISFVYDQETNETTLIGSVWMLSVEG